MVGQIQGCGYAMPRGANVGDISPGIPLGGTQLLGPWKRTWQSDVGEQEASQVQSSGQASFVYMGVVLQPFVPKYVAYRCTTAGTGAQTAEAGWFISHEPPRHGRSYPPALYQWDVSASLTALTGGTRSIRNTTPFTKALPRGAHVWAAWRVAMAATQPAMRITLSDWTQGRVLYLAGASALTAYASILPSGALADSVTVASPRMELD